MIKRDENEEIIKDDKGIAVQELVPVSLGKLVGNSLLHPVKDDDEEIVMAKYLLAVECYDAEEVKVSEDELKLIKKCIMLAYPANIVRGQALAMLGEK